MSTHAPLLRMFDANANRTREALRVLEDYARFALNDGAVSGQLKQVRHTLAAILARPAFREVVLFRDTEGDVGTGIKTAAELTRESLGSVVIANGKRLSEALRVLEECAKTVDPAAAQELERLRYQGYTLELQLTRIAGNAGARARFAVVRLYVLLTESLCHPSVGGWEQTLDSVLAGLSADETTASGQGGQLCIQLREKSLPDEELLRRAKIVAAKCRARGALSIVNDRPDIAILADADGIHVGQTDLPCTEARKLLGPDRIIGVSTENLAQARQAVSDGATYVAVGPMFPTTTKEKPRLAGPAYAAEALAALSPEIPLVPIGGITLDNLHALTSLGLPRVCTCSAIIAQPDPAAATALFLKALQNA